MFTKQMGILNSLVTFAAENIPGGLSPEEKEVAEMIGRITSGSKHKAIRTHVYKVANTSLWGGVEFAAQHWAEMGWRVVGAIGAQGPGFADQIILERPVGVTHPDD